MKKEKINPIDHIGETHGIYTIVDMLDEKDKYGHYIYIGKCNECGYEKYSHYGGFTSKSQINICKHTVLGDRFLHPTKWENGRIGNIFRGMKQRCYNKDDHAYRWYGAKGIKICDEWLDNPKSFEDWALANGYQDNLTIDRIKEDKDYSPDNCRWITGEDNAKYKSTTSLIEIDGEVHTGTDWAKKLGFGVNTINKYIRKYGLESTIEFIKKYMANPSLKPKSRQSYYDLYMNSQII